MKQITLTQGQFALVDDEDYEFLNQWKWNATNHKHTFYAARKEDGKIIYMHRLILGITDHKISDHRDLNGLNNQKYNLRVATRAQNNANQSSRKNSSSKYLGVHWSKVNKKWVSQIQKDGKTYHIGTFRDEVIAALAYNKKAIEIHGEFANLNKVA